MSSRPIHSISLRAICAATESEAKVRSALSLFAFGSEIETIITEGHFGNRITILSTILRGKDSSRFIELLIAKFPQEDIKSLKNETYERVDEDCTFHLRLDKQAAYNGKVKLAAVPDIIDARIKIKVYPAHREKAIAIAETIFDSSHQKQLFEQNLYLFKVHNPRAPF